MLPWIVVWAGLAGVSGLGSGPVVESVVVAGMAAEGERSRSGLTVLEWVRTSGDFVRAGDLVSVHYSLEVEGRVVFDSSVVGVPFRFVVGSEGVPGFLSEVAAGMQVLGTKAVFVPWELGSGREGRAPLLPPESDLVVRMRLLSLWRG